MMQVDRYRIVLTGWIISGYQTQEVVAGLSHLFRIPQDLVRPLLVGKLSIIRRELTHEQAGLGAAVVDKAGLLTGSEYHDGLAFYAN